MSGVADLLLGTRSGNAQVRLWPGNGFRAAPCEAFPQHRAPAAPSALRATVPVVPGVPCRKDFHVGSMSAQAGPGLTWRAQAGAGEAAEFSLENGQLRMG